MLARYLCVLLFLLWTGAAHSSERALTIEDLRREARGQTLVLAVQNIAGLEETVREFQRRFPEVNVEVTVQSPRNISPRILAEQQNGIFAWDSWWALTANMNSIVLPAGGFASLDGYLLLPEVRDRGQWRSPSHLYTSNARPDLFVHSMSVDSTVLRNRSVLPQVRTDTPADLLDPRLKGRIAIRDPSSPNSGTFALAALLDVTGPEYIHRLFHEMDPVFLDNSRQLTVGLLRGDYAVAIGAAPDVYTTCRKAGGCRNAERLRYGDYVDTYGVGVLRNPPNPAAARLWVNWLLSREGQAAFVAAMARVQDAGGVSMRKDVEPAPAHLHSVPDYADLERYTAPGTDKSSGAQAVIFSEFKTLRSSPKGVRFSAWHGLAYAMLCCAGVALVGLFFLRLSGRSRRHSM